MFQVREGIPRYSTCRILIQVQADFVCVNTPLCYKILQESIPETLEDSRRFCASCAMIKNRRGDYPKYNPKGAVFSLMDKSWCLKLAKICVNLDYFYITVHGGSCSISLIRFYLLFDYLHVSSVHHHPSLYFPSFARNRSFSCFAHFELKAEDRTIVFRFFYVHRDRTSCIFFLNQTLSLSCTKNWYVNTTRCN